MSFAPDNREAFLEVLTHRGISERSRSTTLILSICLGWLGADRLYLGYTALGLLKGATFGGFLVWWLLDVTKVIRDELPDEDGLPVR
jgi:TM2 domain